MTSAADPLFVDTNVLVYASWAAAPLHTHARSVLATHRGAGAPLYISRQVIREWLATLNRPRTGLALADLIRAGSFVARTLAEIAGGDDQSLLVSTEATTHLLHDGRLHISFPALDLDGHVGADNITDDECAAHVDPTITAAGSDGHRVEADRREEAPDERLELGWLHRVEVCVELCPGGAIVLLDEYS